MKKIFLVVMCVNIMSFFSLGSRKSNNCYTMDNFDLALKYVHWKSRTSKINKVLQAGYELKVNEQKEILFQKKGRSIFLVHREKGIILLSAKTSKRLQKKANHAFCELVKYASISRHNL